MMESESNSGFFFVPISMNSSGACDMISSTRAKLAQRENYRYKLYILRSRTLEIIVEVIPSLLIFGKKTPKDHEHRRSISLWHPCSVVYFRTYVH